MWFEDCRPDAALAGGEVELGVEDTVLLEPEPEPEPEVLLLAPDPEEPPEEPPDEPPDELPGELEGVVLAPDDLETVLVDPEVGW